MKKLLPISKMLLLTLQAVFLISCHQPARGQVSVPYQLNRPEVIELKKGVDNISGIAYSTAGHVVYAIDDDHGDVYKIPLQQDPQIEKWHFGAPEDFEDIVLVNNNIYVLSSKGRIAYMPLRFPVTSVQYSGLAAKGKNNFETLFKDPASNRLLMVCKECSADSKKKTSVFAFDLDKKEMLPEPVATLHLKEVNALLSGDPIKELRPSAAAVQPQTGEIYMLASVNKLLLILDRQLRIKAVYRLDPKIFKQPEGITFSPAGDLLISNEAGKKGKADILIFRKK